MHRFSLNDLRPKRRPPLPNKSDVVYVEDLVTQVQRALYATLSGFDGANVEDENDLESLIEVQFEALQKAMKITSQGSGSSSESVKETTYPIQGR
ncbi:Short integuments 2, mitochondrial, partial [Cucurbita argyrosperma subsp. argyrosperma]